MQYVHINHSQNYYVCFTRDNKMNTINKENHYEINHSGFLFSISIFVFRFCQYMKVYLNQTIHTDFNDVSFAIDTDLNIYITSIAESFNHLAKIILIKQIHLFVIAANWQVQSRLNYISIHVNSP